MTNHHKNRDPWKFFLLTFAYSWVIWIPSVLDGIGIKLPFNVTGFLTAIVIIGAFAPLLAAITLVVREEGSHTFLSKVQSRHNADYIYFSIPTT